MSVRNLAALGVAVFVVGGALVVLALLPASVSVMGRVGAATSGLGLLLLLLALLVLGRTEHRMLRSQGRAIRRLLDRGEPGRSTQPTGTATSRAAAPHPDEAPLVELADPAAELLRGATPYAAASATLPDDQPLPRVRVRRDPAAPAGEVVVDALRDGGVVSSDPLRIERLPLDRALATSRRRVHPPATTSLELTVDAGDPEAGGAAGRDPFEVVRDPEGGARLMLRRPVTDRDGLSSVLALARDHRMALVAPGRDAIPAWLQGLVLQLIGAGIPCWCPADRVDGFDALHPDLRSLLGVDRAAVMGDDLALAAHTARQKREAWSRHDLRLAWDPGSTGDWRPRLRGVAWPSVAVVLASRRPQLVPMALEMIAAQSNVDLEVVVALHGAGDGEALPAKLQELGLRGRIVSVPQGVPFGAVLNHAISFTSAGVVLKWDDDDLYGPRHVEDLLIARRQTGSALVGRAAEFVYFEGAGETVWRNPGRAEAASMGLAGGTLLADRGALDEIGGYPEIPRAVDHHLKVRFRDRGWTPFRTHAFGFVLRRHAQGHTWEASDQQLRERAIRTFEGLPDVLELGEAARWSRLPAA